MSTMCQLLRVAVVAAPVLLGACASPIKSTQYKGEPGNGFIYHLTKSRIDVTVSMRLEDCAEGRVVLLDPKVNTVAVADADARFRIDPAQSFNIFRANAGSEVVLTSDRRLGSAKAKVQDNTLEFVKQAVAVVTTFGGGGFGRAALTSSDSQSFLYKRQTRERAPPPVPDVSRCEKPAGQLVGTKRYLEWARAELVLREVEFLSDSFKKGDDGVLKAYTESLLQIERQIDAINEKLTKTAVLRLSPAAADEKGATVSAIARFDLRYGWFGNTKNDKCLDPGDNESAPTSFDRKSVISDCAEVLVTVRRGTDKAVSDLPAVLAGDSSPGLIYRVPVSSALTVQARVGNSPSGAFPIRTDVAANAPLSSYQYGGPAQLDEGGASIYQGRSVIAQWGPVTTFKSDLSLFGSSGVGIEFDEWSVPKSVTWSAENGGFAALLGFAASTEAARQKASAQAPADPSATMREDLLLKLLQTCLDPSVATLPGYCSGLVK